MANPKSYIAWFVSNVAEGYPRNVPYYYARPESGSALEDDTAFYSLSDERKLALSTTTPPAGVIYDPRPDTGLGSIKLKELYIYQNDDGALSLYADGTGDMLIQLRAAPGIANFVGIVKTMTTADGPYPNENIFTGTRPYGAYFPPPLPLGNFLVDWYDEDGSYRSFSVTLGKKLPRCRLFPAPVGTLTPDPITPPGNPTVPEQNYTSKGTLGGYGTN